MPKKLPKWRFPNSQEVDYRKALNRMIDNWFLSVDDIIISQYGNWLNEYNDSVNNDSWIDDIDKSIDELEYAFNNEKKKVFSLLPEIAIGVSIFNDRQWKKIMKAGLGFSIQKPEAWISSLEKNFVSNNKILINKMQGDVIDETRRIVNSGILNNRDSSFIKRQLMSPGQLGSLDTKKGESNISLKRRMKKGRARVIAGNEIGNLNATLTKNRQTSIGVIGYVWRNVKDERVRGNPTGKYPDSEQDHWSRDGKKFLWDYSSVKVIPEGYETSPPVDGNAGEPFNCRCFAEPDFSSIELPLVA